MTLIKNEKLEDGRVELQFSVDAQSFKAAISNAFKKEGKKYEVPGFRKGHAPRSVIEKMYGAEVFHYDAVNALFPDAYEAAVKESGIEPVDMPEADIVSISLEEGVTLKATVTVKPEVKIGAYKGLEVAKADNTVEDVAVDAEIERMADRNSRMVQSDEAAKLGDTATIDFEGFADGVPFEGGKGENFALALGSGQFIPGFEEKVVGHTTGEEFDVDVTFPEEYHAEELAGKPVVFKCKIHKIEIKEMPVIDDEFAKDVSDFDTLAELRDSIRKNLEEKAANEAELAYENALVDKVVEGMEVTVPACMVEQKIDEMVRDFAYRMESQGLKLDMYLQYTNMTMDAFRDGFKEQAEGQVKIRLALEAIVAAENIAVTDEEFDAEVTRIASSYQMDESEVRKLIPVDEVRADLAMHKAIDLIKAEAK